MRTLMVLLFVCMLSANAFGAGKLLLIGGGKRPEAVLKTMITLAGQGGILIVPLASEIPDEIAAAVKAELTALGTRSVSVYACDTKSIDREDCLAQIASAGLIFFTGGDQNRLSDAFKSSRALDLIRARHLKDLSLAGTSAGTAVMSEVMLTGEPSDVTSIHPGVVQTTEGFGFVKKLIIDQHFLKRGRESRLISAVLDHPKLVGVGIDEATAILVDEDESFQVLGYSAVMVIDARHVKIAVDSKGNYQTKNLKIELRTPAN